MQTPTQVPNIGADVAKDEIVVASSNESFPTRNLANQRTALLTFLKGLPPGSRIGMESTGIYHELFANLAYKLGFTVFVLNPKDARNYAKGVGLRGKTDRVDAELIARMIEHEHTDLHAWTPPTPEQREMARLLNRRAKLSSLRQALGMTLKGVDGFATDASIIKADAQRQRAVPGEEVIDWGNPEEASRPVREYLEALEEGNPSGTPRKSISLTDPSSSWTAAHGPAFFGYSTNYLIDLDAGIIVDVEPSAVNKAAEVDATKVMIERVEDKYGMKPERLVGDTNYGSAGMVGWLVDEKKIAPHVSIPDKSERKDGTFGISAFTYDAEKNCYVCPAGKILKSAQRKNKKNPYRYRASQYDCRTCQLKPTCCPNMTHRKIDRSPHEPARDVARKLATTDAFKRSFRQRKKVEMLFAHLKRILRLDRLRLRGWSGARDEFLMAATVQNLRRMAKWLIPVAPEVDGIPA